jgi:serine protease Do
MSLHHSSKQALTRSPFPSRLAVLAVLAVVGVALAGNSPPSASNSTSANPNNPRRTPLVDLVERVRSAVVNIHSERTVQGQSNTEEFFAMAPSQHRVNGMGTGILIDPRGYIITNQHVVDDVNNIRVRLADGANYTARVVARDAESDLALLKIESPRAQPVMPFGTATDLMVGESVVAIGNAYGYEHTVTRGIVSAVKRDVTLNKDVSYKSLIQTDASINPGNSGGPLLNINGDLIGVNVAIRAGAQGIGFAIPVDNMLRVAADMMSIRKRNGTTHGMIVRDRVDTTVQPPIRTLVVERADATGPAGMAGIQSGDLIELVGDTRISCALELERSLLDHRIGEHIPLVVLRGTEEHRVDLVLASADKAPTPPNELIWRKLGLRLSTSTSDAVAQVNQHLHGGLLVNDVQADSIAGKAGIQKGDILVGLHQWETVTLDNVAFVLTHPDLASFNPLRFYIVRGGQVHRGWLQQVE